MKYVIIPILLALTALVACKSLQNNGGTDWAVVEFSIDGAKQNGSQASISEGSLHTTAILAVPASVTTIGITDYLSDYYDTQLQGFDSSSVNLRIPLNTSIRLAKIVFNEVCSLDEICYDQPTAFCGGVSDIFSVDGSEEKISVAITMGTSYYSKSLTSFKFEADTNSYLSADVIGSIDEGSKTIDLLVSFLVHLPTTRPSLHQLPLTMFCRSVGQWKTILLTR